MEASFTCKNSKEELKQNSLFYRLGGYALLEEAVDLLLDVITVDQRMNDLMKDKDIDLQRAYLKSFLAKALGVPSVHGDFGAIGSSVLLSKGVSGTGQFIFLINYLRRAFLDLGVSPETADEAIVQIIALRNKTQKKNSGNS